MRNIQTVINQLKAKIPVEETGFHNELQSILDSSKYVSPEMAGDLWIRLSETFNLNVHDSPNHEWKFKVISIFTNIPVNDVKQMFK